MRFESCGVEFECSFSNRPNDFRVGFVECNMTRIQIVQPLVAQYIDLSCVFQSAPMARRPVYRGLGRGVMRWMFGSQNRIERDEWGPREL
jgi:hypothetical protein